MTTASLLSNVHFNSKVVGDSLRVEMIDPPRSSDFRTLRNELQQVVEMAKGIVTFAIFDMGQMSRINSSVYGAMMAFSRELGLPLRLYDLDENQIRGFRTMDPRRERFELYDSREEAVRGPIPLEALELPLTKDSSGQIRIRESNHTLDEIVACYEAGSTPEQIASKLEIDVSDVYTTVAFYLNRRDVIDEYLSRQAMLRAFHAD